MRSSVLLSAFVLPLVLAVPAFASTEYDFTMTMTFSNVNLASGGARLGSTSLAGDSLTITGSYNSGAFIATTPQVVTLDSLDFSINGGADFTDSNPPIIFENVNAANGNVFQLDDNDNGGTEIIEGQATSKNNSLLNPFGPITITPDLNFQFATSEGQLSITKLVNNAITLTVADAPTVVATPEPASLLLLSTGMLGFAGALRRRFRQN